ncbi:uncharacterized protein HD556DRAFT_1442240 [Suillus plorans]|uniref:Uncharacterized protein n=1 Tax=Suillus plorans TaxID=116603 RepID=A0A9P7ATX4_9AGAM|nr:uncharacterized protein HD556DRAFT_1442240 [Suillus plorans]KAG1795398.1 hypothetical protein HD556DRAFT_1442240 [Suillus plorans]
MSCRPQRGRTVASFKRLLLKWTDEFQIYLTSPREKRAAEPGHLVQMALGLVIEQVIATKLMQELTNTQSWRTRRRPKLRRSSWYPPPHPPQSNVRILHPSTLPHANVVCHSRASLACSGSRKRVPLPPQRDSFQEGSRGRADVGYRSPPSATRDSAPASRLITNDARIPSGPRLSPLEISRDTRSSDARGSRQAHSSSALHSNSQTDTYAHNESRDKRGQDQMDVEDPPAIIAKSTEPSRQLVNSQRYREDRDGSAPKRPRAMMDDVEVPARRRSPDRSPKLSRSEWKEPHRTAHEDVSRAAPSRDERRAPVESSTRISRDTSRRHVDMSRPPPSAPTPKLSGTNSMPIGGRGNRFGDSASISPHPPLPSASFLPLASSASRRGVHVSGSNAQPVVSRPVRQPAGAMDNHDRLPRLDDFHDRERSTKILVDQRRQTERIVSPLLPRKPLSVPDPPANAPINTDSPLRLGARAARTRFGPPVPEPEGKPHLNSRRDQTPESPHSHHDHDHATSPPLSRNSSTTSARDAVYPSQQSKHDGDVSLRSHRPPESRPHGPERKETNDLPEYPRSSSHNDRRDHGPPSLDHNQEWHVDDSKSSKWSRTRDLPPHESLRHADAESSPSGHHAANGEGSHQSLPLAMHPERARLLQSHLPHSLPPRPDTEPRRPRSTRPRHGSAPWAPSGSRFNQHFEETSFHGDRFDRSSNNHGSSLIDRLAVDGGQSSFSLRDRVKVPMKRPSDDPIVNDALMDVDDGHEGSKRSRRRGGKPKRPRRVV